MAGFASFDFCVACSHFCAAEAACVCSSVIKLLTVCAGMCGAIELHYPLARGKARLSTTEIGFLGGAKWEICEFGIIN